jgi:hypothetical protein
LGALNPATAETIRVLNSVSPGLGDEIAVGLTTDVETEVISNILALEYGVTDRLSIGVILPVIHGSTVVKATTQDDAQLNARIESLSPQDPRRQILQQVQQRLNVEAFDNLIRERYNYSDGFNSWSGTGFGDLELGAKYKFYSAPRLRSTLKAGVRLPSGREDNPDQLFDFGFGDGQVDLGLYHLTDFNLTAQLGATLELGYVYQVSDSHSLRIPLSPEIPLSAESVEVSRKLGDYWNAEFELNHTWWKSLTASARYRYYQKSSDSHSHPSLDAAALNANTSEQLQSLVLQLEYTNLAAIRAGTARLPYAVGSFYRMPITGKNVADSRTLGLSLKTYF